MLEPEPQARSEVEAQVMRFPEANHALHGSVDGNGYGECGERLQWRG